tara:strand:- start:355 stop:1095 length:741 start_codon:yes stop_codon:yes gene_type:complete
MQAVIKTTDLRKTYFLAEPVHALRKVDITINPGEFVSIMGASGSGKSTLMNIIGCLDRPTSGNYLLDGVDVSDLGRDQRADIRNKKIGFVFQGFNLLARTTALANVELPLLYNRSKTSREATEQAIKCLERVGLGDRMDHHPSQLSGGQQQRVAIARALVNQPALILADEPTGNLDTRTSLDIMGLFQELNAEGVTIVIVTHEPEITSYTKRSIEMRDGLVIDDRILPKPNDARHDLKNFTSVTSL